MGMTTLLEINNDFVEEALSNPEKLAHDLRRIVNGSTPKLMCIESVCIFHRHDTQAHKDWLKFKKKFSAGGRP